MSALFLSCVLVVSVVMSVYMAVYLLSQKSSYAARFHTILCLSLLCYSLGYLLEINASTVGEASQALLLENLGIPAIGPFFLLSIMQLCDSKRLRPWMGYLAMGHVLFVFLAVFTNPYHGLFYTSVAIRQEGWTRVLLGKGPLYYYNQLVSVLCALGAYGVLAHRFAGWSGSMRQRMTMIVVGSAFTLVGNFVNMLGLLRNGLDMTVFAYSVTLVCFFIAVHRNRLYELAWLGANQAVQSMDDVMVALDNENGLVYFNDAAAELFVGIGNIPRSTPIAALPSWPLVLRGPLQEGQVQFNVLAPGGERYFRCNVSRISPDGRAVGPGWSIVMRDVTETVRLTRRLEELADTDALTGIYNRRHFLELLELELVRVRRYGETTSLILFDIDHFKKINDTFGHTVGDKVLEKVVATVQYTLRLGDVFCRYGGEEFLILCPSTSPDGALHLAERIRQVLEATPILLPEACLHVKASFGVAELRPDEEVDEIITHADQAMYLAKQEGRNTVRLHTGTKPQLKVAP